MNELATVTQPTSERRGISSACDAAITTDSKNETLGFSYLLSAQMVSHSRTNWLGLHQYEPSASWLRPDVPGAELKRSPPGLKIVALTDLRTMNS